MDSIKEALTKLDVTNDDHWTSEGLPRLDVMKDLVGSPVGRAQITSAAKGFTRSTPVIDADSDKVEVTSVGTVAAPSADRDGGSDDCGCDVNAIGDAEDAAVEAEHGEATKAMEAAKARLAKATKAMDVVIAKRETQSSSSHADLVKAFQASQAAQRAGSIHRQRGMIEAALAAGEKF